MIASIVAMFSIAAVAAPVTFNKQIAPIMFAHCAPCHRPGEAAPFPLLTYADVKKHARQIADVTARRFMPPWLPAPGFGDFAGQQRLTDIQIATIRQWAEQGAAEGAAHAPQAPAFTAGWQLGEPDLILTMPQPWVLPSGGADVYRNFVLHVPVAATRYVRALEIRPGNKRVLHHANVLVDRAGSSRARERAGGETGFEGMDLTIPSNTFDPDSHFLFWKPGALPVIEPAGMSWRVDPDTDLVLNMHLQPTGKPEAIQASIGLYFTDTAPTKFPMLLQLENDGALDIPPGRKDFPVADDFTLPVDVDLLAIYPHAHFLGKRLEAFATLPGGEKKWLIRIPRWDLNWQAVFHYARPVGLPKGTVVSMRYVYDNSADNLDNPHQPPQRVVGGNRAIDEMSHLWLQVLPRGPGDQRAVLQEALMRTRLHKYPADFSAHFNLGAIFQAQGKTAEAIVELQAAVQAQPLNASAHNTLGTALASAGNSAGGAAQFQEALRLDVDCADAHFNLGSVLLDQGDAGGAAAQFRAAVRLQSNDDAARTKLAAALTVQGNALARQGQFDGAATCFEEAVDARPGDADAYTNLGSAYARLGRRAEAETQYERALLLDPQHAIARKNLEVIRALDKKP